MFAFAMSEDLAPAFDLGVPRLLFVHLLACSRAMPSIERFGGKLQGHPLQRNPSRKKSAGRKSEVLRKG
jgi:hypothetical protein